MHSLYLWMMILIKKKYRICIYKHQSFLKYRKKRIKINQMEIQHETTTYYCFIKYQGKLLMWADSKIVQNTFDSWKCQLLCNKMSKVENSCKPRLKTILKQHHVNVNRAQMNKYLCVQNFDFRSLTWTDLHICTIWTYANWNLHLDWTRCKFQEFAYGANFVYVCKSIHMDRFAHVSKFACMQILTQVCRSVHVNAL